jgi:hypothetical protein
MLSQTAARPARLGQDQSNLASAQDLSSALEQTPVVRADQVARARDLVRDVSYPPQILIQKLSVLLATHLAPKGPTPSDDSEN